jgi:ssDNA-binding replication factor A large subunit
MKISDIVAGMSNVSVEAKVVEIPESRDVQTRYGPRTVADATLEDETGQISISLWEKQINSVAVGDRVRVVGAYVTKFRDKLQLNIPKSGRLEVLK